MVLRGEIERSFDPDADSSVRVLRVLDADEEIFHLYTALSRAPPPHGLGQLSAHSSSLFLSLDLALRPWTDARGGVIKKRMTRIDLELAQDLRSLRDRAGDTASVVWRASWLFCQLVMAQNGSGAALLDLSEANVVELGGGTGLTACAIGPLCRSYIATDQADALPLLRRNIDANAKAYPRSFPTRVEVIELDWTDPVSPTSDSVDLVLAIDCLFNDSLAVPLLSAIEACSTASTTVLVLSELRDEDVMIAFTTAWLASGRWTIRRLLPSMLGDGELAQGRFVVWIGRRIASPAGSAG